jgi:NitT/TauT family transport system substrate-binding protein
MKKNTIIISIVLLAFASASSWYIYANRPISKSIKISDNVINIGVTPWPGYLPLYVARDKGFFKKEGVQVNLISYEDNKKKLADILSKKLEGAAMLSMELVNEALQGVEHVAVLAIDTSNGSDAIVTSANIKSISDLKGKRIAYDADTFLELFLHWALINVGLSLDDIISIDVSPDVSPDVLKSGNADAAITYEPYLSELRNDSSGRYHSVYSSADASGLIVDVLAFTKKITETNPKEVQAVVNAYFQAIEYWKLHPEDAHAIVAKEFGGEATAQTIQDQLKGIIVYSKADNDRVFTFGQNLNSLYGNLTKTEIFLKEKTIKEEGLEPEKLNISNLIDARFLE